MKRQSLVALVLAGMSLSVFAQTTEDRLTDCAGIVEQQQRLACYDALARAVAKPAGTGQDAATPASPESALSADEGSADEPSTEKFGLEHKDPNAGKAEELRAVVTGINKNSLGKMTLTLDNGQVWQQKDSKKLILHEGDSILIERGALTAFYLSSSGNKRIAVARIR